MKFIFLVSGMNSWENTLPIVYEFAKNKKNKIIIGIETKVFYKQFLEDQFKKDFIKNNKIFCLHLGRPKSLNEYFNLLKFYFFLVTKKFNYILETLDFDKDLRLTNLFLKMNMILGCKRVKIFADSLSVNELKNTQIFYDTMKIENKKLNFSKYDFSLLSNSEDVLRKVYKNIIFSKNVFNIGRIKLNQDWLKYINNYYKNINLKEFDILVPLSATKGKFLKGYDALDNETKLLSIFEIFSKIEDITVTFKPHSKSDMIYFKELIKKFDFNYKISNYHLNYLCSKSKIVLTYHPTSAQVYAKCFGKTVIEFGEYDKKIENILNGKARYFDSVDKRVLNDKQELELTIRHYLNNNLIKNNVDNIFLDELSNLKEIFN